MERIEALIEFNACRAAQERLRASQAPSQRARVLHEEMAAIFEARAEYRRRLVDVLATAP